jgi:hypothetical protein
MTRLRRVRQAGAGALRASLWVLPMSPTHLPPRVRDRQVKTQEVPRVHEAPVVQVVQVVLRVLRVLSVQEDPDSMV